MQSIILFIIISALYPDQVNQFDFDAIRFRGHGFSSSREAIIKTFGKPQIVYTDYECGFYTNDQPGGPYYQLVYAGFNFIGSDKEKFILENVTFGEKGEIKLKYKNKELNAKTSKAEFIILFGEIAKKYFRENPGQNSILLLSRNSDDGAVFHFKNDKLVKYQYWSPC